MEQLKVNDQKSCRNHIKCTNIALKKRKAETLVNKKNQEMEERQMEVYKH